MREQAGGTVVNVTSMMGHVTLGCHGYYSATKFALAAISESLAIEARPFGIKVAIIEPGVIVTPIFGKSAPTMPENHPYQQAMARLTRVLRTQLVDGAGPEIVANAIFHAVGEGCVKLRYPVGPDAEVIAATHDRMTPAEWVALLSEPDDEKFLAAAEQAFGVDLFNPPSLYKRTAAC
jgi:NAD(P)-dependent dehydrogenase (short-subunit alcohol dehydrogenase family)